MTYYIQNAGFDEDLIWQADGSKKDIVDRLTKLSNRSLAGVAADGSLYALVNPSTPNKRMVEPERTLEATNGFIGVIEGWTTDLPADKKCEWVYFGTVPYDLGETAVPVADDGDSYLSVPAKPEPYNFEENKGMLYLRAGWGGGRTYRQTVKLPCAVYRLEYWTININANSTAEATNMTKVTCCNDVFKDKSGKSLSSKTWAKHVIEFTSTGEACIEVGFKSATTGSGNNPIVCFDGIKLYKIEKCGDGVTYYYEEATQTLTISKTGEGTGEMYDYDTWGNYSPWYSFREDIVKVVIEEGVTSIGNYAFFGCSSLASVTMLPVNPPFIYNNTFSDYTAELNVPSGSAEAYGNADYWKNFSTINDGNIYHELTVTASGNGTVGYNEQEVTAATTTFDVKVGDNAVLTLTPDAGYSLASLTVNGEDAMEQVSNGTLTLSDVRADMTVVATFALVLTDEEADLSQIADAIYIEPTVGCVGRTVTIDVKMKNSTLTPVGCSFTLTLPDRLRLQTDEDSDVIYALGDRAKKLLVTMDDWDNGTYDFTLIPTSNKTTITGTDDTFITFTLPVPADMAAGDYRLGLTNGMIQTRTGSTTTDHPQSDVLTRLTIAVLGDANGDGSVTPADAIMILYAYFGVEQANFNRAAADLNGDKDITPADAIEALYRYFGAGGGNSNTRSVHPTMNGGKDPE